MTSWVWWYALPLAGGAIGISIWAGPNLAVALPAAIVAVIAVLLLVWAAIGQRTRHVSSAAAAFDTNPMERLQAAFRTGAIGRSLVIAELDGLDRSLRHDSSLGVSPHAEQNLLRASEEDFRRYVRNRLQELEKDS